MLQRWGLSTAPEPNPGECKVSVEGGDPPNLAVMGCDFGSLSVGHAGKVEDYRVGLVASRRLKPQFHPVIFCASSEGCCKVTLCLRLEPKVSVHADHGATGWHRLPNGGDDGPNWHSIASGCFGVLASSHFVCFLSGWVVVIGRRICRG